jgi:integral membrane protein (TIGR03766 family)
MKTKFFNGSNAVINVLFAVLIFTALYFALISPNLLLKSEYTNTVTIAMLGGMVIIALAYAYFNGVRTFFKKVFVTERFYTAPLLFMLAVGLQWFYVWQIHPAIGFDVSAVHDALLNPNSPDLRGYFSINYNNLAILLFQRWLSELFHNSSWFFFATVSVGFTTAAALFNLGTVAVINWRKLPVILYLQAGWMFLFPMSIVPYTDIWSLPFVSLYILCYLVMAQQSYWLIIRLLAGLLGGGALVGAYLLKPSAIIPLIALVLVSLLALLKKRSRGFWLKSGLCFLVMIGSFSYGVVQMKNSIDHQDYIMVDKKREKPPLHFIQIGMTDTGGYSPKDDLMMGKLYSKKAKEAYSLKRIKQILHQRGLGYVGFLVTKQGRNTADATFSWGLEGHFFKRQADNERVKTGLASFVYPQGDNLDNFRFVAQLAWIVMLTLIAFGWRKQRLIVQALRLGMIGGFIFLLFFEGGRSRYLIQFLPVLFILATLCSQSAVQKLRTLFSWVHA